MHKVLLKTLFVHIISDIWLKVLLDRYLANFQHSIVKKLLREIIFSGVFLSGVTALFEDKG
jgi:hypothetical protein